jgi:hypothetical protein
MSIGNVLVNDTVRIRVKFVDVNPDTSEQVEVSPVSVSVNITDKDGNDAINPNPDVPVPSGGTPECYYDFTPTEAGEYSILFLGLLSNGSYIRVTQQLYVSTPSVEYKPTVTLREDEVIVFAPGLSPLYLDPEELLPIFPDATLLEIGEIVHRYSHEINQLYGITQLPGTEEDPLAIISNVTTATYSVLEYIRASVACELSRTYGFGGDDELSLQLGDLQISNKNVPRATVTRANATTWCQIAAALRKEILTKRVGLRGVQPKGLPTSRVYQSGGSLDPQTGALIYINDTNIYGPRDIYRPGETSGDSGDPMPDRNIKRYD